MRTIIAFTALSITAIKLCLGLLLALYRHQSITVQTHRVLGKGMRSIDLKVFKAKNKPLANVDLWLHYLKGNFDLVGPKALPLREAQKFDKRGFARFDVAPGLVTPYEVKSNSGIAHANEQALSSEFAKHASLSRRTQILTAAVLQRVMGNSAQGLSMPDSIRLFDVGIDNVTMTSALDAIMRRVRHRHISNHASQFSFVNADCVNTYVNDPVYRRILNACESVFADGIGLRIAARWHRTKLKDNVNGTDLFPLLCQRLSKEGKSVFLYGGKKEVVAKVVDKLTREYPSLALAGSLDGYTHSKSPELVSDKINVSGADVVLVALGAPLQETWIAQNKAQLKANVAIGVGGLFDFYSGSVSRAPEWVRELSMEWVWRLFAQPKDKAKRYLIGNPQFLARIILSRATNNQNVETLVVS